MTSFRITTTCSNCGKIIPRNFEDNKSICYECLSIIDNTNNTNYGWMCPICNMVYNPTIKECNCFQLITKYKLNNGK